ncbi:MAG: ribonuclease III [Caulobacterales bacterium]
MTLTSEAEALQERLGYEFADRDLFQSALTHASAAENAAGRKAKITRQQTNQRLEFLGDRVLGLIVADELFRRFGQHDEGGLTIRFNSVVSLAGCARAARRMELGRALILSPTEDNAGGRLKEGILGDAAEAILAALYLDGGLEVARGCVLKFWGEDIDGATIRAKDPKNALQEWAAAHGGTAPAYRVVTRAGPDHAPSFEVEVVVGNLPPARAVGKSKQEAERAAALAALEHVGGGGRG